MISVRHRYRQTDNLPPCAEHRVCGQKCVLFLIQSYYYCKRPFRLYKNRSEWSQVCCCNSTRGTANKKSERIHGQRVSMKCDCDTVVMVDIISGAREGTIVDGVNLDEIREFAKQFKIRRLSLGLTQTQVGQALSATEGPSYSQSAICRLVQQYKHVIWRSPEHFWCWRGRKQTCLNASRGVSVERDYPCLAS